MSNESRERIYAQLLRTIRARIDGVIKLPDDTQLSLACALNLLFLLKGERGSIGDYVTTFRALQATVGDDLIWAEPSKSPAVAAPEVIQ
ncbi:MAG TPA: hypothetical protein VLV88_04465 [Terriglobales bacterium]|nr:hypothetical protein [Terriglobales bacterium]